MNILNEWALKWGVAPEALNDLSQVLTITPKTTQSGSENEAQSRCRVEATRAGGRLWRNNSGVATDDQKRIVRFGLCNDSARINKVLKSSDLIGLQPVLVQQYHVGTTIGQFVAREIKKPGWKYSGTPREEAQKNYLCLVNSLGGDGRFSTGGYNG